VSAFEEQIGGRLEAAFNGPATRDTVETLVRELADGAQPDTSKTIFGTDPYYGMARIAACFEDKPSVEATMEALASLASVGKEADQEWARKTLQGLHKVSPTSLKVTLAQIQRGRCLNLKECLELEYRIAQVSGLYRHHHLHLPFCHHHHRSDTPPHVKSPISQSNE
jgi:enoyl-CoA hydratase